MAWIKVDEGSIEQNSVSFVSKKESLIENNKKLITFYLKNINPNSSKHNESVDAWLDLLDGLKNINENDLDEKDLIFFHLLDEHSSFIFSFYDQEWNVLPDFNLESYWTKLVDLEWKWSCTMWDFVMGKDIDILDNELGLDIEDFLVYGESWNITNRWGTRTDPIDWKKECELLVKYKSPLYIQLATVKQNNQLDWEVFSQRLIKKFDYIHAVCNSMDPYCLIYVHYILLFLGCSEDNIAWVMRKYYSSEG